MVVVVVVAQAARPTRLLLPDSRISMSYSRILYLYYAIWNYVQFPIQLPRGQTL